MTELSVDHFNPSRWESEVAEPKIDYFELSLSLQSIVDSLAHRIESKVRTSSCKAPIHNGRYPYIPYPSSTFIRLAFKARQYLESKGLWTGPIKPSFVDVGCGTGLKLYLAQKLGFEIHGIEYQKRYVKEGIKLYGFNELGPQCNFTIGDALEQSYGNYDVIYFYRPIADQTQMTLENIIYEQAKVGAVLIPCGCHNRPPKPNFEELFPGIFLRTS